MKKVFYILSTLVLLTSCNNQNTNKEDTNSPLFGAINNFYGGVKLLGTVDTHYVPTSSVYENVNRSYEYTIVFQEKDEKGYETTSKEVDNDNASVYHSCYFRSDDGYVSYESYDADNTITKTYAMSLTSGKVNYDQYFSNPFLFINELDFTKSGDNLYSLNLNKAYFLMYFVLGQSVSVQTCYFTLTNNMFTSFYISSNPFDVTDNTTGASYKATFEATFELSYDDALVTRLVSFKENEENSDLKNALNNVNNDYTLDIVQRFDTDDTSYTNKDHKKAYCDKETKTIYVDKTGESSSLNGGDYLFIENNSGYLEGFNYDLAGFWHRQNLTTEVNYESVVDNLKSISTALFTKQDSLTYVSREEIDKDTASISNLVNAFIPPYYSFSYTPDSMKIVLNDDKKSIKYFDIYFTDSLTLPQRVRFTYENVGSTDIPNYVKDKLPALN